jgi:dimethylargininase
MEECFKFVSNNRDLLSCLAHKNGYVTCSFGLWVMGGEWSRRKRSRAIVREVSSNFNQAISSYFGTQTPDPLAARDAHADYVTALREHGVKVDVLPGLSEHPDCTFVEDAAIVVDGAVVIPHMGHPSREGEQKVIREMLGEHLEVLEMPQGATMDGGDAVFFDDRYLLGMSKRTNAAGIAFFQQVAASRGFDSMVFEVPDSTLHLTTICSSPKPGMLVTAEGHMTPEQLAPLSEEGVDILWVPNEESYAANVIGFEGGSVMISANYPETKRVLEAAGFSTRSVDMEHIRAADGSLTCCSVFYQ